MKRGGLPQMDKNGNYFNGSGASEDAGEPVQRATAAQLAARKMKAPRSRRVGGGGGFGSTAPTPFGSISGNAGQTNGASTTNGFGAQAQGASFSFGASAPAPDFSSGANGSSQGYQGSMFQLPGSQNQQQQAPPTAPDMFNSPSSFSFGNTDQAQSTGFSFGQSQSNANGAASSLFGASSNPFGDASQPQQNNLFSTPAAQPSSNPFSSMTQTSTQAPQTAPAQTSNLFGGPAQGITPSKTPFTFGSSQPSAAPSTPAPLFGEKKDTAQASPADMSMSSPDNSMKPATTLTPSSNMFASATPAQATTVFAGFGQTKASEASTSTGTSATPAASSNIFGTPAPSSAKENTTTSDTPAKPVSNMFNMSTTSFTPKSSLFDKAPTTSNLFGAKSSDESTPLPWNKPDSAAKSTLFNFASPAPAQPPTPNLFSPAKPTDAASTQTAPEPSSSFFNQTSSTAAAKPTFDFQKPAEPATSENESGQSVNIFNAPPPSMSTLNSAATPASAPGPTTARPEDPVEIHKCPPAPGYCNSRQQRHEWRWGYQIVALEKSYEAILRRFPGTDKTELTQWYNTYMMQYVNAYERGLQDRDNDHEDAPPSKRANTGLKSGQITAQGSALFSNTATAPSVSGSNPFTTSTASAGSMFAPTPRTSSNLFGNSTASNLFSSTPVGVAKRKSEEELEKERQDGSIESTKKTRTDEAVSYPKLPESSSKTSQLFAQISNDTAQTTPAKPATSSSGFTPSASAKSGPPTFTPAAGGSFLSQFGQSAKKDAEKEMEKAKDNDYDSEEETEEQWEKRHKEEQEKKKADLQAAAKSATGFVFNASVTPSRTPSPFKIGAATDRQDAAKPTEPAAKLGGSLFNRISKDANGNPIRSTDSDASTSKPLSSSMFEKPASNNLFGNPAIGSLFGKSDEEKSTSKASAGGIFDKPTSSSLFSTPAKSSANPFGASNNLFAKSVESNSPGTDNTFKGDSNTPLKFSTTTTPAINLTEASPQKPAVNGVGPIGASLFSKSQPIGGSIPGGASIFAKNNTFSQSLAPGSVTSDTSRATSPGTTGDEGGDDDEKASNADSQLDLAGAAAGEEDEDTLFEVKARGLCLELNDAGTKTWVSKAVGQLKLLRHQTSRQTRVVLRSIPAGKVMLNANLIPTMEYKQEKKSVKFGIAQDGSIRQWACNVKEEKDAKQLAKLMDENKKDVA